MRIARYRFEQDVAYGIVDGEQIREIAGTPFPEVAGIEVTQSVQYWRVDDPAIRAEV